jgi:hypothetical protein
MKDGREATILGGKRNFGPCGVWPDGSARRSMHGQHELPVMPLCGKVGRVSLVRTPLWLPVAFAGPEPRSHAFDRDRNRCMPTSGAPLFTIATACIRRNQEHALHGGTELSIRVPKETRRNRNFEAYGPAA